jgi:purine-nucleoside phosphorylase
MLMHPSYETILGAIRARTDFHPRAVVILGSGLSELTSRVDSILELPYGQIDPAWGGARVTGHPGRLIFGRLGKTNVAVFAGRRHLYEGIPARDVILPVQIAKGLGAEAAVLTCAAGALNESYDVGDLVLMRDHINLMGTNPIFESIRDHVSSPSAGREVRFVNLDGLYATGFADELEAHIRSLGGRLHLGTLAAVLGPVYETPAERRMMRSMGADMVSMSTVPEAIASHDLGLKTAALCLITNKAGAQDPGLSHQKVLEAAGRHADRFASAITRLLELFP